MNTIARGRTTAASNDGSFTFHCKAEADTDLLGAAEALPWAGKEPFEVDTALAELWRERSKVESDQSRAARSVMFAIGAREVGYGRQRRWSMSWPDAKAKAEELAATDSTYSGRDARKYLEAHAATVDALEKLQVRIDECDSEFTRRGGWTRAFLVVTTGSGGHVHSSMSCSTCNRMGQETNFVWLPEYSGRDEDEIVGDAGERACTVCYPSAPVDVLNRPTKIFSEDERKAAEAREERARAAEERKAKQVAAALTPDGSEFVVEVSAASGPNDWVRKERFKTERSAAIWAVDAMAWGMHGVPPHLVEDAKVKAAAVDSIIRAVADKHGRPVEEVRAEFEAKATKKVKSWAAW